MAKRKSKYNEKDALSHLDQIDAENKVNQSAEVVVEKLAKRLKFSLRKA